VAEVLSDSSRTIDRFVKRDRYAEFGVPEYWLLDPFEPRLEVLRLEAGKYRVVGGFRPADTLNASPTFPGVSTARLRGPPFLRCAAFSESAKGRRPKPRVCATPLARPQVGFAGKAA
jgi:Putative restriction endonuclease